MLDVLSNERFRGRKLLSCLAFPFINHRLTDLLSLQITPPPPPPPPIPKALLVQRTVTPCFSELSLHLHGQLVQRAERSRAQHAGRQAGKFFTCCFIQNIHKERRAGAQRVKATPPPPLRIGCGRRDDKHASTVTGCQMIIYFSFSQDLS